MENLDCAINIPFRLVEAAAMAATKKDSRYYLIGVHVTRDFVEATDGHKLVHFDRAMWLINDDEPGEWTVDASGEWQGLIVPLDAIAKAAKTRTKKQRQTDQLQITHDALTIAGVAIPYRPIDGGYPNTSRVRPSADKFRVDATEMGHVSPVFNWYLVAELQAVMAAATPNHVAGAYLRLQEDARSVAKLEHPDYEWAQAYVMPVRL